MKGEIMHNKVYLRAFLAIAFFGILFLFSSYAQSTDLANFYANTGAANQPPSAKSLAPDNVSPQMAGTIITWTGTAYDPDGDTLLYQFWLNGPSTGNKWRAMTSWKDDSIWNWSTSNVDSGNNFIDMRVRDVHHAGPWDSDSHISSEFFIDNIEGGKTLQNTIPKIISLKPDKVSPQDKGVKITWTSTASDPDGDTVLYQYWLKGPSTDEQWMPMTTWTTNNAWTWNTGQSKAGGHIVEVRIRDGYHANAEGSDDSKQLAYILGQRIII